jgi:hypothetical protein
MNDDFGVCYSSSSVMGQFKIDKKKWKFNVHTI